VTDAADDLRLDGGSLVWARRESVESFRIPHMREELPSYARGVTDPLPDRPPAHVLGRLVDAIGLHVFLAEVIDGVYHEVFTGPGAEALMGGPVPAGIELDDAWPERVHPDDYHLYRTAMERIHRRFAVHSNSVQTPVLSS